MAEANRHAGERPPFPSRIQRDRHGGSGAEACQEQLVRPKPPIGPAGGHRLVGDQTMTPRRDLLGEAVDPPTHNHDTWLVRIDHERPPFFRKAVRPGCGEWPGAESNCRHADFQSAALPTELPGRTYAGEELSGLSGAVGVPMFAVVCPFVCRCWSVNRFATASARSASSMMLYRSNIARVFQPHRRMISPSDTP